MSEISSQQPFVVPSEIPFEYLRGHDLEECLYWLLDAMGAKELEWHVGGRGSGAADGGRDLEAHFLTPTPDGEIVQQKWWIEAKGRSGTVEPCDVKAAVLNAGNRSDLDVLIVATNTAFSNPTRDWVREWQGHHPRPVVRLWERARLEKLLSEYPSVVVRLFSKALSIQGRLEVIRYRVWNFASLASNEQLLQM